MKAIPAMNVVEGIMMMDEDGEMRLVREVEHHHKKPRTAVCLEPNGNWENHDFNHAVFVEE